MLTGYPGSCLHWVQLGDKFAYAVSAVSDYLRFNSLPCLPVIPQIFFCFDSTCLFSGESVIIKNAGLLFLKNERIQTWRKLEIYKTVHPKSLNKTNLRKRFIYAKIRKKV